MSNGKSKRRLLAKGMEGADVRDVQRKLNARRISEKKLAEDGKFDDDTDKCSPPFGRVPE